MKTWLARIVSEDLSEENCQIEIFLDDYEVVRKPKPFVLQKLKELGLLEPNAEFEITEKGEIQPISEKEIPEWYEELFENYWEKINE